MRGRPTRRDAILGFILLGVASLLLAVPTWLTTTGATPISPEVDVVVTGTVAAPGVGAAALVLVAGALALGLVGRVGRWVVLVVEAVSGVVLVTSALGVRMDPTSVATTAAADRTGVTTLTSPVEVSVLPVLVAVLGVLVVLLAVLTGISSSAWKRGSVRHERPTAGAVAPADEDDPAGLWDEVSRGGSTDDDGPTAGEPPAVR